MRIGGIDPKDLPTEEVLVLPRGDRQIVFRACGLPDMEEFKKLCPEPEPPGKLTAKGFIPDKDDPGYKSIVEQHDKQRLAYMVVKSLAPSKIEWDTVVADNPATWLNWETDLKAGGFSQRECSLVLRLVWEANSLDEERLRKARESFLAGAPKEPAA